MTLRSILLGIQYICIVGMFLETWIIFRRLKNDLHAYLLMSCISALINNIGYLLELTSTTEEGFLAALKFSYFGRIWYAFFLWLFVAELVRIRVPNSVRAVLLLTHAGTYLAILTLNAHSLYYTHPQFKTDGMFARLEHGNGILHHIHIAIMLFYIVCGIAWLMIAYHRETNKVVSRRLFIVTIAVYLESVFFLIQIIGIPGLTGDYDVTILGFFLGTIFMLVAILSCDLLGTGEIARDFVIDKISEGIIAVDKLGRVQYYNRPAAELFPELSRIPLLSNGKLKENRSHHLLPAEISRALKEATSITVGDRIYLPEENELLYEGESFGKLYVLVDETDHYSYMEELKRQRRIAEEASEAKSRFLANMSHEIRTPINAVLGMDEMILREAKEENIRQYAENIRTAGTTLLSLINDILDFSKIEAGKMEIMPVEYASNSILNDLVNMIRQRAEKKGLEFRVEVPEDLPSIMKGDEVRLRQVVTNILTNAVKYTEEGSVTLKVDWEKTGEREVELYIGVRDTGMGIKEEDMERLFQAFQRVDEERNRTIEGTGLGLNITQRLLQLMGSRLEVVSRYGSGSVFFFKVRQEVLNWAPMGNYEAAFRQHVSQQETDRESFVAP
ncbi:MAG: histidine kinase, partial [Lachnospiraceae bacterium]|nr:histidine kinase [Lachnospiraceae bacterium]